MASPKLVSPLDLRGEGLETRPGTCHRDARAAVLCVPAAAVTLPTKSEECNAGTARLRGGSSPFGML